MSTITRRKRGERHERIPVLGELRITTPDQCPRCGSQRKTAVASLGWVCTKCFDRCKEEAERLVEAGSGVSQMRAAYELAVSSYKAHYGLQDVQKEMDSPDRKASLSLLAELGKGEAAG